MSDSAKELPTVSDLNMYRRAVRLGFPLSDETKKEAIEYINEVIKRTGGRDRLKLAAVKLALEIEKVNIVAAMKELPQLPPPPPEGLTFNNGNGADDDGPREPKPAGVDFRGFLAELRGGVVRPAPGSTGESA